MADLSRPDTFAALAIIVDIVSIATYILSIHRHETRPHVFSWFVWGLIIGIGAVAQLRLGAGPSSYVLLFVSACELLVAAVALFAGEKNITRSDWAAFCGALLSIVLWQVTNNPVTALLCLIMIDCLSYWPTVRKSWTKPTEESAGSYLLGGLGYFLALLAIPTMDIANIFYPFFLMATDWGFMGYILWRRQRIARRSI